MKTPVQLPLKKIPISVDPKKKKILTRRGYFIEKKDISSEFLEKIKKDLKIKITNTFNEDNDTEYTIFQETKNVILIPKIYGDKYFSNFITQNNLKSEKSSMKFTKSIRDYQEEIIKKCLFHFRTNSSGLIVLSCGLGKTCIALFLACYFGLKTLVVVDRGFLQNQWKDRAQEFTTAKIGIIRGDTVDTSADIVIGMVQSISKRNYPAEVFNKFGLVIFDECHTVASKIFCKSLGLTCSLFNIGLTATPYRKDDLMKVVKWYLGDEIINMSRKQSKNVIVKRISYYPNKDKKLFVLVQKKARGVMMPMTPTMTNNICSSSERNKFLCSIILELSKQKRKLLLLGERNEHIKDLKKNIDESLEKEKKNITTSLYIGKMKQQDLETSSLANIIFSNYKMASTGLDIDGLDTLVFLNGKKDVVQSIGRILRKPLQIGMNIPLIVDIVDMFSCFSKWGDERNKYYCKQGYTIKNYNAVGEIFCNPRSHLKILGKIKSGEKHPLKVLKNIFFAQTGNNFFMKAEIKQFLHSSKVSTIMKNEISTFNEKIEVVNNINCQDSRFKNENLSDKNSYFAEVIEKSGVTKK